MSGSTKAESEKSGSCDNNLGIQSKFVITILHIQTIESTILVVEVFTGDIYQ